MEKGKIKPLGENVLIESQTAKKKTEQGIYLPETGTKETPQEGKIIAIGEAKEIKVKKGQTVIFRPYSGTDIKVGDKKYIILKNEDILAVLE
ncbi:MAG: co-chaperone GroES [Candidatus Moranbacteria bacterium RIFOXYA12_FULL_35_19]|nr:MAG: 10 kDa chaperonin [Candidatus Moranbacteria bacterium GW2011_GWF2_35_39]OGI32025.1 MAG: co-chaperone GroES [Candidatus Moranbacteria bacterium RIFOXYB12_FULL_35_8]OGI32430.1 MAG: co-chaperone GroES [Candidatus Moranbacteria bacterium RIFOXYC12_FULL_36_13]OGI35514.1 MAG: co-chaperone GroES [Candidatus Moranbacteria bacterium RIFOXYA12_FULL_35_19]